MKKYLSAYFIYYPIFWVGYLFFKLTKKTNWYAYISFRRLFVFTKGGSNDAMSNRISKQHPPAALMETNGILGTLNNSNVSNIVNTIKTDGFYIFDVKLPQGVINELTDFALKTEATLVPPAKTGLTRSLYVRDNILSPRYEFSEQAILNFPLIQKITSDQNLFSIAQEYLACEPIQDLTAMWWSAAYSKDASSEAAQLYHFDMDRFKFIKFFFYLTDVDTNNGPHCYVRGTHKSMPDQVWRDGRIQDADVAKNFAAEDVLEIQGKKGTIMAVDTRGLHKGKVLNHGERLLLQVEFTNSLFGASYNTIDLSKSGTPEIKEAIKKSPYAFQRYKI